SSWITQSRLTGLALIERNQIVVDNARFRQLGNISHKPGKWIVCGNDRQLRLATAAASLAEGVRELAGRLLLRRPVARVNVRYKCGRGERVLDARLERGPGC